MEKEEKMDNGLSDRERLLIRKIRESKNPKQETTYLISYLESLQAYKPRLLFLPGPRAAF